MKFVFMLPWLTLSVCLSAMVTSLIVVRLLIYRRRIFSAFGPKHATPYASTAAMVVESAALPAICSLLVLILYTSNPSLSDVFLQILGQIQVYISKLLLEARSDRMSRSLHLF